MRPQPLLPGCVAFPSDSPTRTRDPVGRAASRRHSGFHRRCVPAAARPTGIPRPYVLTMAASSVSCRSGVSHTAGGVFPPPGRAHSAMHHMQVPLEGERPGIWATMHVQSQPAPKTPLTRAQRAGLGPDHRRNMRRAACSSPSCLARQLAISRFTRVLLGFVLTWMTLKHGKP